MSTNIGPLSGDYENKQISVTDDTKISGASEAAKASETTKVNQTTENNLQALEVDSDPTITQYEKEIQYNLEQIESIQQQINAITEAQQQLTEMEIVINPQDPNDAMAQQQKIAQKFSDYSNEKTGLFSNIQSLLSNITFTTQRLETYKQNKINQAKLDAELARQAAEAANNYEWTNYSPDSTDISLGGSDTGNTTAQVALSTVGNTAAQIGLSFVGKINSDSQGNKQFSGGAQHAWCADFVTWVTKKAYEQQGKKVPSGFGSAAVSSIRDWGIKNGMYVKTAGMSATEKANYIAKNIKPGDIIIQKENGSSHTGIVVKVYPDGSFETVEGNTSDSVKRRSYKANDNKLSGFVRMP